MSAKVKQAQLTKKTTTGYEKWTLVAILNSSTWRINHLFIINLEYRHFLVIRPLYLLFVDGINLHYFVWNFVIIQERCERIQRKKLWLFSFLQRNNGIKTHRIIWFYLWLCCRKGRLRTGKEPCPSVRTCGILVSPWRARARARVPEPEKLPRRQRRTLSPPRQREELTVTVTVTGTGRSARSWHLRTCCGTELIEGVGCEWLTWRWLRLRWLGQRGRRVR